MAFTDDTQMLPRSGDECGTLGIIGLPALVWGNAPARRIDPKPSDDVTNRIAGAGFGGIPLGFLGKMERHVKEGKRRGKTGDKILYAPSKSLLIRNRDFHAL
jgi:hypothetical protein